MGRRNAITSLLVSLVSFCVGVYLLGGLAWTFIVAGIGGAVLTVLFYDPNPAKTPKNVSAGRPDRP